MSSSVFGPRDAQTLEHLMAQGGVGWDFFKEVMPVPPGADPYRPSDRVAKVLYGLSQTADGRAIIEWLMDITLRAPLRLTGATLEETALRAAARQGINGVGEVVLAAIDRGRALTEKPHDQSTSV